MVSHVQFETIGGGTSGAVKATIAGAIGLVAVGLVLLLARSSLAGRREGRAGAPTSQHGIPASVGERR